ncbi:hypothetical protein QS257_19520 [Terrilactibacillus sp. S3-3]|nr:hypothetical protein QS257_19520 [Terrilactibacillus sp. S3-3]
MGEMPLELQVKLLRVLQEKNFSAWAATSRFRLSFESLPRPTVILKR